MVRTAKRLKDPPTLILNRDAQNVCRWWRWIYFSPDEDHDDELCSFIAASVLMLSSLRSTDSGVQSAAFKVSVCFTYCSTWTCSYIDDISSIRLKTYRLEIPADLFTQRVNKGIRWDVCLRAPKLLSQYNVYKESHLQEIQQKKKKLLFSPSLLSEVN